MSSEELTVRTVTDDWPLYTILVAIVVAVAFFLQLILAPARCFDTRYPAFCAELALLRYSTWLGVVLMPFLHGSWLHLGRNLLLFVVFGGATESLYGRRLLLWFFVSAGYLVTEVQLVQKLAAGQPPVTVGISGAVFALGALLGVILCPTSPTGLVALYREMGNPAISLRPPLLVMGLVTIAYAILTHVGVVPIDSKAATLSHLVGVGFGAGTAIYLRTISSNLPITSNRFVERN